MLYYIVFAYLLLASVVGFAVCAADKRRAEKRMRRVPERTLFLLAAAGGSFGVLLGMLCLRHKTRHRSFTVGIPLILLAQIVLIVIFVYLYQQNKGGFLPWHSI